MLLLGNCWDWVVGVVLWFFVKVVIWVWGVGVVVVEFVVEVVEVICLLMLKIEVGFEIFFLGILVFFSLLFVVLSLVCKLWRSLKFLDLVCWWLVSIVFCVGEVCGILFLDWVNVGELGVLVVVVKLWDVVEWLSVLKEGECGICCENFFVEGDVIGMEDMVLFCDKLCLGECFLGVIDLFLLGMGGGSGDVLILLERWMWERL